MTIPYGFAAIVTRYGRSLGVYAAGWHWLPPWYQVAALVNTQFIPYNFKIKQCPTRDNNPIKIDVDLMFRIVEPLTFFYDIGVEKLEELLRSSQAESVRSLVRSIKASQAYDLRGTDSSDMLKSLNDKLNAYGVHVEFITIANVILPANMALSMQSETIYESKQTEQKKKQEFELKVLNDNNYLLKVKQDRENERAKANEEAKRSRASISQEIQSIEVKMNRVLSEIEASKQAEMSKLQADARLDSTKVDAEKDRALMELRARGKQETEKIKSEADKYSRQLKAEAKVVVAQNEAKSVEQLGEIEQKASTQLKVKRQYDLEMENALVWNQLSKNSNVLIAGDSNSFASQLFSAEQLTSIALGKKGN
jgi:regulator of protease activity HflC (stomatin/prohibitin superfamily)